MRIIVTAGPTREYIDSVRFITNASSGRMGCAAAAAAGRAGHAVTLLAGPGVDVSALAGAGVEVVRFVSVADLKAAMEQRFADCDALVMAAAPGDFRPEGRLAGKLRRGSGPLVLRLAPTEDILAGLGSRKRPGQIIVAFAVEEGSPQQAEAAARRKLADKNADYIVVNAPAAMAAEASSACILGREGVVLPWAERPKDALAGEIVKLLGQARPPERQGPGPAP